MRNSIYMLQVCQNPGTLFCNKQLPKGAIYGADTMGVFYCQNYRIKGMAKNGRPILEVYRYDEMRERWQVGNEANATTDAICDYYLAHETQCEVDFSGFVEDIEADKTQQHHIEMLKISRDYCTKHNGKLLPKGAMYGVDEKGAFICKNYRLQTKNGKKSGYINGMPCLIIMRPQRRATEYSNPFYEKQSTSYNWHANIESNNTTLAIIRMYDRHPEKCEIKYLNNVREVAEKQTHGLDYTDPVHFTSVHGKNAVKGERLLVLARPKSLEEMAEFQRGKLKW